MKASFIQKYSILIRSVIWTLWISIKVLIRNYSRAQIDNLSRIWSKKLLAYVRVKYKVFDPHHFGYQKNRNYILMTNHESQYDIPVILAALPGSIRMLAKKELFKVPIWGKAMKKGEFISIDRHNRQQAIKDLKIAREKMQSGIVLWVAPEGTRSRTKKLLSFKKGGFILAKQTDAIILPVGIRGTRRVLPPGTLDIQVDEQVEIHIGEPVDSLQYSNCNQLMQIVRQHIQKAAELES